MFDDMIRFRAALDADAIAFVAKDGARTFATLEADIRRAVHELRDLESTRDEPVAVEAEPAYLRWVLVLALARLAIASSPGADRKARVRITTDPTDVAERLLLLERQQVDRILTGPEQPYHRVAADPQAPGAIFMTSGTTGPSKRVALSWRTIALNVAQTVADHSRCAGPWLATTGAHTLLGFGTSLAAWAAGKASAEGYGPDARAIATLQPGLVALVPIQLQLLLDRLPRTSARWPLRVVTTGSALPPQLLRRIRTNLTSDVFSNYACTEASQVAAATLEMVERDPRTIGYPRPGVAIRVIDDQGRTMPHGELGRLCFRTGRIASGYIDDPELTAECFQDGWFISRDLGREMPDGLLLLEGRTDEVMNLGGHKIPPGWVEGVALECRGVTDAGAFALMGESGLERCGLAVVTGPDFDIAELRTLLRRVLMASQQVLILSCPSIPRNLGGKIDRARLREMAERGATTSRGGANGTHPADEPERADRPPERHQIR